MALNLSKNPNREISVNFTPNLDFLKYIHSISIESTTHKVKICGLVTAR